MPKPHDSSSNSDSVPILAWVFAGLGVCLIAMAAGLHEIMQALLARTHQGHPALTSSNLMPLFLSLAAAAFLAAAAAFRWRNATMRFFQTCVAQMDAWDNAFSAETPNLMGLSCHQALGWLAASCAVVLLFYFPTIAHGYFAYDDYEILGVTRIHPLHEAIFKLHGDHTMPLLRIEAAAMVALAGTHAWFFNLLLLAAFALLIFFGILLLREMDAGILTAGMFLGLISGWMLWSEFLAGYYTISTYLQQTLMSVLACWTYRRWQRTGRAIYPWIAALAVAVAIFLDISGFWVPAALATFVLAVRLGEPGSISWASWLRSHLWLFAILVLACVPAIVFNAYVFTVLYPNSFLNMKGAPRSAFGVIVQAWYYTVGGAMLAPILPVGYWKLPQAALIALLLAGSAAAIWLLVRLWTRVPRLAWWLLVACLAIIMGNGLMVAMGRPQPGFSFPWQTKYVGSGYVWYILGICLLIGTAWRQTSRDRRAGLLQLCSIGLALFFAIQTGGALVGAAASSNSIGYSEQIADADRRQASLKEMRDMLAPLFARAGVPAIPLLPGNMIASRASTLGVYDLVCYRDFVLPPGRHAVFVQNAALAGDTGNVRDRCGASLGGPDPLHTVDNLRIAVGHPFLENLKTNPLARKFYLSGIALAGTPSACASQPGQRLAGAGTTVAIRRGRWQPETSHELSLTIRYEGPAPYGRVFLRFGTDLGVSAGTNWIDLPRGQTICRRIDLLQLYSYALPEHVQDLQLQLPGPGSYRIMQLDVQDH